MSVRGATGRCLCGAVRWSYGAPFDDMFHCHCGTCRKVHGTAYATYVVGSSGAFRWESTRETVRENLSHPFCAVCGSKVPWVVENARRVVMPAGSLEGELGVTPRRRVNLCGVPPWLEVADAMPQEEGAPAGHPLRCAPVDSPPVRAGATGGSCACGTVRFELEGPPLVWMNCHCWRCRRARGTAHASNLAWKLDALRHVGGEDALTVYDLPEAQFFGTTFCSHCGGFAPRRSEGRGFVVIPCGTLDSDPGVRPSAHQFLSSRAPWFEFSDDLPRFQEAAARPQPRN